MLKSILNLIEEFILQPALLTTGVLLILAIIILFFSSKNIKTTLKYSVLGSVLSFLVITIFMVLSVKLNEPKYLNLIYPFILNVWYITLKKNKYRFLWSNIFMIVAFLSDFYLVEKLLFE